MNGEYYVLTSEKAKEHAIKAINRIDVSAKEPIAIHVERKGAKRTKMQNSYLWGWVYAQIVLALKNGGISIPLKDGGEYPYDADILHQIFKRKFLAAGTVVAKNGSELVIERSTTDLSKKEFSDYVRSIDEFCHEFWHITIPAPVGIFEHYRKETVK